VTGQISVNSVSNGVVERHIDIDKRNKILKQQRAINFIMLFWQSGPSDGYQKKKVIQSAVQTTQ
jgi:hypothetical protein